jgi:F-type H+-transporting ATPase subunit epsilon
MNLEILTPEKKVFEGEVVAATFPGADGSFQILKDHAPLVGLLRDGIVEYRLKDKTIQQVAIIGGVVEVLKNRVIVLADGLKA